MDQGIESMRRDIQRDIHKGDNKLEAMNALDSLNSLSDKLDEGREDSLFALRLARKLQADLDQARYWDQRDDNRHIVQIEGLQTRNDELQTALERMAEQVNRLDRQLSQYRVDPELQYAASTKQGLDELRARSIQIIDPKTIRPFMLNTGKIPTIKLVRELTGLGLKDAKDMVDGWVENGLV